MNERASHHPLRVVIAGGGVAGLETLLALDDLAGRRVELTLVSADSEFTYKPMIVGAPFAGAGHAERRALEPVVGGLGARFVQRRIAAVAADRHAIELADGELLGYDALVIAIGARSRAAYRRALTFDAGGDPLALSDVLADVEGGWSKHVAFIVPPGATWPLPIYELALMTRRQAWGMGIDDLRITVVTPEAAPLAIFGPAASGAVAELLARRQIDVLAGSHAREDDAGRFVLTPGDRILDAARVVALPLPVGPAIPGLPADDDGFIPTDEHSRVRGVADVYAAGDGTAFPVKQGGIATQQADAAAEHIAARAGAPVEARPFHPVLRGKLLTGDSSLYVRHDVRGGSGEATVSEDHLWWPPHKISGRYLAPWLAGETPHRDPEPPQRTLDVEVTLPHEWHEDAVAGSAPSRRTVGLPDGARPSPPVP